MVFTENIIKLSISCILMQLLLGNIKKYAEIFHLGGSRNKTQVKCIICAKLNVFFILTRISNK